jgi:predicted permease
MTTLWNDIRYGLRSLAKSPGFAAVAVISLALGIGANTAVFSLYNAAMLKVLPVRDPRQLRVLNWRGDINANFNYCRVYSTPAGETSGNVVSYPLYCALRDQAAREAQVFAFSEFPAGDPLTVIIGQETFTAQGLVVSGNFFEGLGAEAKVGQTLGREHDRAGAEPAVVISHAAWQRYFNGDVRALGQTLTLNRHGFTLVGVLAEGFLGPIAGSRCDFYVPMSSQVLVRPTCPLAAADVWWVQMMARLSPQVSDSQFQASLQGLFAQTVRTEGLGGPDKPVRLVIEDGSGGPTGPRRDLVQSLPILMGMAAIVLLAACANLASLLLARAASRQQEAAVRAALGAGTWRLVRQHLTESLLIALAGAAGGLVLAAWAKQVLLHLFWPSQVIVDLGQDVTVLGFTLLICLGAAVLFGLAPAWRSGRTHPMTCLKGRSVHGLSHLRWGRWMVSIQTALAVVLLAGAGLFVHTLVNLTRVQTGFRTENILVFQLDAGKAGFKDRQVADFHERVRASIAALPSVRGAAQSNILLLSRWMNNSMARIQGRPAQENFPILGLSVSDSFLATMGIPLRLGRDFGPSDSDTGPPVILVNETLARRVFPSQSPIDQTLTINNRDYRIVGVFGDITYADLKRAAEPTVFYASSQQPGFMSKAFYEIRTASDPLALVPAIRRIVTEIDRNIPMTDVKTQALQRHESIARERCLAVLALSLALLAVAMCCIGLFGLVAYQTARRTGEIGVRMALGARPWDIGWSVLADSLRLVLYGLVLGVPLALVATRLVRSTLFGIEPHDPATLVGSAVLLILVSLAAVWLPARRAAKTEPMEALRCE